MQFKGARHFDFLKKEKGVGRILPLINILIRLVVISSLNYGNEIGSGQRKVPKRHDHVDTMKYETHLMKANLV